MTLDERDFRTETGRARCGDKTGCASADNDEIVARRRRWISPVGRMRLRDEFLIVMVPRRNEASFGRSVHIDFLARAFLAMRVSITVTAMVARRPRPRNAHCNGVDCWAPA